LLVFFFSQAGSLRYNDSQAGSLRYNILKKKEKKMNIPVHQIWKRIKIMQKIVQHLKAGHYCYYSDFIYFNIEEYKKDFCIRIEVQASRDEHKCTIELYSPEDDKSSIHKKCYPEVQFKDVETFDSECQTYFDQHEDLKKEKFS